MKRTLRAFALAGILASVAAAAQAQARVFAGVRAPVHPAVVVAVPPCPGVGYVWTAGYYDGPVFVPGRWVYRGYDHGYAVRDFHRDYRFDHFRDRR